MKNMREDADPVLYKIKKNKGNTKWSYNTSCPNQQMRQPYIINKEDIESFDPKAISGYMKYRNNYYICPRIWDYQAIKPINVDDFIKNEFKSPYTNGMVLDPERRGKQLMNSKYNVIIRKPSSQTNSYWENEKIEKDWPKLLKGTGTEAYPGLMSGKGHPQKLCYPCCFKAKPRDFDETKRGKELQQFTKPYGTYGKDTSCVVDKDRTQDLDNIKTEEANPSPDIKNNLGCVNQNYIIGTNIKLDNCRYGLLPDYIDVLLNNHQDIFLNNKKNTLNPLSNLFLRKGVKFIKTGNFLHTIAMIKNISIGVLRNIIFKSITPEIFMTLNNGDLISIYASNDLLPNTKRKHTLFSNFINDNLIIRKIFNISIKDINKLKYDDITKLDNKEYVNKVKHIIIVYKLFTSYHNFMRGLYDDNEIINYKHFLDLISRKNDNLFSYGVNILIFNNKNKNLVCNPYLMKTNDIIILLKEGAHQFTPIYNVRVNSNSNIVGNYGDFRIYKFINIDKKTISYLKTKNINVNILEETQNRSSKIFNLLNIHNEYCNIQINSKTYFTIKYKLTTTYIKGQIITNTPKVQFLLLAKNYILPIQPISIIQNFGIFFLDDIMKLTSSNIVTLWKYYENINDNLGDDLGYKPIKLITYNKQMDTDNKLICGIMFKNNLILPVNNIKYDVDVISKLGDIEIEDRFLYHDEFIGFQFDKNYMSGNITELLAKDYIYQQFKYDFSYYINEYENKKYKKELNSLIKNPKYALNLQLIKYQELIINMMKSIVSDKLKNIVQIDDGLYIGVCYKYNNKDSCNKNILCNYDKTSKKCKLNMNNNYLLLFAYLLANDLINSKVEREQLMNGIYIPTPYLSKQIYSNDNDIIIDGENIKTIDTRFIGKYRKEYPIINFEKTGNIFMIDKDMIKQLTKKEADFNNMRKLSILNLKKITKNIIDVGMEYLLNEKNIYSTIFDKNSKLDKSMGANKCIFPFFNVKTLKLEYNCVPNSEDDHQFVCPVNINNFRKPLKFGYCPENPNITNKRENVVPISTSSNKQNKNYYNGTCKFPYYNNKTKQLQYECEDDTIQYKKENHDIKVCPIEFNKNILDVNKIPIAATSFKNIWDKKWKYNNFYKENTFKFNNDFLNVKKYGFCQPPNRLKEYLNTQKYQILTLENYNENNCLNTPSKGGYTKLELFVFGMNELKIPFTKMIETYNIKNNKLIILQKNELCSIINERYNNIKKLYEENKYIYTNLQKCMLSPLNGGKTLKELRQIAIKHYNLKNQTINNMNKEKLCNKLYNIYLKSLENEIYNHYSDNSNNNSNNNSNSNNNNNDNNNSNNNANNNNDNNNNNNNANKTKTKKLKKSHNKKSHKMTRTYDKDIKNCKKSPQRGAYTLKNLKELAVNKFKLNISGLSKNRICDMIEQKLNLYNKYSVKSNEIIDLNDNPITKTKLFD